MSDVHDHDLTPKAAKVALERLQKNLPKLSGEEAIELIFCRSQIIPTIAAIAASMAFTEAQKMRRSFKAWGFEEGPGNVNK